MIRYESEGNILYMGNDVITPELTKSLGTKGGFRLYLIGEAFAMYRNGTIHHYGCNFKRRRECEYVEI